jgi:zinc protease
MQQQFTERDKTNSSRYVDEYVSSALWDTPIVGIEQEEPLAAQLAPTISVAEVNALALTSLGDKDRVVLVAAPAKPEVHIPTAQEMLGAYAVSANAMLTAYIDRGARSQSSCAGKNRRTGHDPGDGDHRVAPVERREGPAQADGLQGG